MLLRLKQFIYKNTVQKYNTYKKLQILKNNPKIFVIGRNKTGTTSLHKEFLEREYIVGDQREAELLIDDYIQGDFDKIIAYCKTALVFQDFPFSFPETYKHLQTAYPNAKFILTVRDSPEQWYNSVTKFHAKLFGNGKIPNKQDLINAKYVYKGWMWKANRSIYKTPEDDIYNKKILIDSYIAYNKNVREYFKESENFLEINLSSPDSYHKFCSFLNIPTLGKDSFPWENKTSEI